MQFVLVVASKLYTVAKGKDKGIINFTLEVGFHTGPAFTFPRRMSRGYHAGIRYGWPEAAYE